MKVNGVIQRKFALLDQQVMRLKEHLGAVSREQFAQNWALRTISERAIQVCVEIMIDVAERVIAQAGAGPTATAAEAIDRLVQLRVLRDAEPYRSMVRMHSLRVTVYPIPLRRMISCGPALGQEVFMGALRKRVD
jgi:uncharacterized protein YutE (UPF0331/DUF86 family)